ncbi:hypothetical protein PMAYCL1PPCAC_18460, partial [Pristionchus mayeri]
SLQFFSMPHPVVDSVPLVDYFKNLFQYDVEFADEDPSNRCMRGAFHVLNVSKSLLVVEMVVFLLCTLFLLPWCLLWLLPHLFIILSTLYALKRERPRFLWPIIIFAATEFFIWCLVSVFSFSLAIFSTHSFLGLFGQGHHEDFFTRLIVRPHRQELHPHSGSIPLLEIRCTQINEDVSGEEDGRSWLTVLSPNPPTGDPSPLEKLMTPV